MLRRRRRGGRRLPKVRLRITGPVSGSIDGIQLDHFEQGEIYDVGTNVGSYLLAIGAAEPVSDEGPAAIVPTVRWETGERRIPLTRPRKPRS
jgi:hypothetical protein